MVSNMSGEKHLLSEEEIDEIVVNQADDDMAWDEPISVKVNVPKRIMEKKASYKT